MVANVLSRKFMHALMAMNTNLSLVDDALVAELVVTPKFVPRIIEAQLADPKLMNS